jgi:hypothetical protein
MLGKTAICWECDEMFVMDETAMKDDMPKCPDCRMLTNVIPSVPDTVTDTDAPIVERTPEQQIKYEKEMRDIFGPRWKMIK